MAQVRVSFGERSPRVECQSLTGKEQLGEPASFELAIVAVEPLDPAAVLRKPCAILIGSAVSSRVVHGVVTRIAARATSQTEPAREYRVIVRSHPALLEHRRRSRVFQNLAVPAIVQKVLLEGGYPADAVHLALREEHPPHAYVVQYAESDAAFLRRLCEEEGLYFRFESSEDGEIVVLEDTSLAAPAGLSQPLSVVDESMLASRARVAFGCQAVRQRRPGKVVARDYDHEHPAVQLESTALAGTSVEATTEVYTTPASSSRSSEVARDARLRLQALRAEASVLHFRTTALELAPGVSIELAREDDVTDAVHPEGKHLVVGLEHRWTSESDRYDLAVRAIPLDVSYRLPRSTPRPRIVGLHSAVVTGAAGEEVHVDAHGRIRVRFPWDREGPSDHRSSLPVRVMQPNMPGSMVLPRVGWEVLVAFEDGDPERPVILGRAYNGKQPPPLSLPANKTMTSLATRSSPGGAKQNSITFDDAAGRQHFAMNAAFGKTLTVGGNMTVQTAKNEKHGVNGNQSRTVGGSEAVSVKQAYLVAVGSQSAAVGGSQKVYVKGDLSVSVGSEAVSIGGALLEKVGDPASGAANLAFSRVLAGAGSKGAAGLVFAAAAGIGKGAIEGAQQGGAKGAATAAGMGIVGMAAGMLPGGDAILSAVTGVTSPAPWNEPKEGEGDQEAGGGAGGGASDQSAPKGPGPGHRNTMVRGSMLESIGAVYGVTTPGSITWVTAGPSTILVGGSHSTTTAKAGFTTAGASNEVVGCLQIKSKGHIERVVKGPVNTTIAGSLTSSASGKHQIKAGGPLTLKVGGSLTLSGAHVTFECGSSKLSASPGGVLIEASTIKFARASKQSGAATHE